MLKVNIKVIRTTSLTKLFFIYSKASTKNKKKQSVLTIIGDDDIRFDSLTSHNRTEIDHIRMLFFQIRFENLKRGPPGFQFFVCFMMFFKSSDLRPQSQHNIVSQRGSTQLCVGCFDLESRHKIIYN